MEQGIFAATASLLMLVASAQSPQDSAIPAQITPEALEAYPADTPTAVVTYGTSQRQFGELRVPEGKGPF